MSQIINCQFEFDSCCSKLYSCRIQNQKFPIKVKSENFIGKHGVGKSNENVEELIISHSNLPNILGDLGKVFVNIKILHIFSSNFEAISKFDLQQFPNLEKLSLVNNPIEYLPGDLFEFTRKIEIVSASPNIKFIGPKLLDGLELKRVDFCGNKSINEFFNSTNSKTSLESIKSEIKLKCEPPTEFIENKKFEIKNIEDLTINEDNVESENSKVIKEFKKHFPDKKFNEKLLTQPERLKKLIDTKISLEKQLKEIENE